MTAALLAAARAAREARDEAHDAYRHAVVQAHALGASQRRIAAAVGVSKGAVQSILSRREGK